MWDVVDFLYTDEHQCFLQVNAIIFGEYDEAYLDMPEVPSITNLQFHKRSLLDCLHFLDEDRPLREL